MTNTDPYAAPTDEPTAEPTAQVGATAQTFRWTVALIGAFVASLGISGLIDDSGLIEHPWWAVVVAAAIAGCILGIVNSVRSIAHSSQG